MSLAVGIMTVTILVDHDMIFYEVYRRAKKYSLGAVLGRARALTASLYLTILSYGLIAVFVAVGILPLTTLAAPIVSALILVRKAKTFDRSEEAPP